MRVCEGGCQTMTIVRVVGIATKMPEGHPCCLVVRVAVGAVAVAGLPLLS